MTDAPALPHLLLLSASKAWTRAVHQAAGALGVLALESTGSPADAMRLLVTSRRHYTHLLMEPGCAGDLLALLVDLTAGDSGLGTELVVLGRGSAALGLPRGVRVIAQPDQWLVRRALQPRPARPAEPAMRPAELSEAMSAMRIRTRYQPIVRMGDRAPVAMEALARLKHPSRGLLGAGRFVPQIEDAGLAAQLTERVAARALADLASPALAASGLAVSINFPLDLIVLPAAIARLEAQRGAAGVAAGRIMIELTESQPVHDLPQLRRTAERLRALGYDLAIDDVAPDVANHAAMMELPFTTLKLAREVVLAGGDAAGRFLDGVMASAGRNHLTVIAEGIEDAATWQRMAERGVDQAQGFVISRPLPAASLPVWLKAWADQPAQISL